MKDSERGNIPIKTIFDHTYLNLTNFSLLSMIIAIRYDLCSKTPSQIAPSQYQVTLIALWGQTKFKRRGQIHYDATDQPIHMCTNPTRLYPWLPITIYMSRLFRSLLFEIDEPLVIEYDHRQTIRQVVVEEFTKALGKGLFQRFREMIGLEDQTERLSPIRQEDELREKLIQMRTGETDHMMAFTYSRDLRRDPWRRRRRHYRGLAHPFENIVCSRAYASRIHETNKRRNRFKPTRTVLTQCS